MADIPRFRVVTTYGATSGRANVKLYEPGLEGPSGLVAGHSILGLTATASDVDEEVTIVRSAYVRGLGAADITGWEPSVGALLWCGDNGQPTTTKPEGARVIVGTYMGGGACDVNVEIIPTLGELSFVAADTPEDLDILVWDETESAWKLRSIYSHLTTAFMFMGGD